MDEIPQLPPGQTPDLKTWSDAEIEAYAEELSHTTRAKTNKLSKDDIVSYLKEMKRLGIKLTPARLDKLLSGDPILDLPDMDLDGLLDVFNNEGDGNPFLRPSLLTIFTTVFMEITSEMAEMSLVEAEIVENTIYLLKEMGLMRAEMKMNLAEVESKMYMHAMIGAIVGIALTFGLMMLKLPAVAAAPLAQQFGTIWENASKIVLTLKKGEYEAEYEFLQSINSIFEKRLSGAGEDQKELRDLVQKFLETHYQMGRGLQTGFGIAPQKG